MTTVMMVALVAMRSEIRRPKSNWAKMSRPVPHSTPSGCSRLMPPQGPTGPPPMSLIAGLSNEYGSTPMTAQMTGARIAMR